MFFSKLLSAMWLTFALIGLVVYGVFDRGDGTFYDLRVADRLFQSSIWAHVFSAVALLLGSRFITALFLRQLQTPIALLKADNVNISDTFLQVATVFATFVCVVSNLGAYGVEGIIFRTYYIPEVDIFVIAAQLFGVLATLLAAILSCRSGRLSKYIAIVCFIFAFLLIFAKGSRYAVIALIIFQFLPLIVGAEKRNKLSVLLLILVTALCSYFLLHASLFFRADSQYGLAPYFTKLPDAFDSLADNDFKSLWDSFLNITFSIPVTEVTIQSGSHNVEALLVAISPLSGEYAGWYDIAHSRRISEEIPYSAIGELWGFSPFALIIYFFAVGVVFAFVEYELNHSHRKMRGFLILFTFAFCLLFGLFVLQYNLRSATRMIYYLSFILLLSRFAAQYLSARQFKRLTKNV